MEIVINYYKSVQPLWKISWPSLVILKMHILSGKVILLLVIYVCTPEDIHVIHSSIIIIAPNYHSPKIEVILGRINKKKSTSNNIIVNIKT